MGPTSEASGREGQIHLLLSAQPLSVSQARSGIRDLLLRGDRGDLVEPAVLLVSEIVTNALLHAGTDIEVTARLGGKGVRVEVGDGSPHLPLRRRYATTSGTGRGLMMLESMVQAWGVTRDDIGKTVWFELDDGEQGPSTVLRPDPGQRPGGPAGATGGTPPVPGTVLVELLNMPLLLHAAWQEHAEALLREYLLAGLDEDPGEAVRMHAEANDALALLEEHLPPRTVTVATGQLMLDALEPAVSLDVAVVPVPLASVPHFETLERAVDATLGLAREGRVLAPAPQPEVQAFRRWLCREVRRQAAGGSPKPWAVPDEPRPVPAPAWQPSLPSGKALVAADQTGGIVAVTAAAAHLLGYRDPAELVGRRVVSIVPERYRQAHVAGFTLFTLVGRRPLLDRVVTVPALRGDGSEVMVGLLVRERQDEPGQPLLLLAELLPAR